MVFSRNVGMVDQEELFQQYDKYLGLRGREMLIEAVTLSIPTCFMSCFKLPSILCNELEQIMAKFWWEQKQQ